MLCSYHANNDYNNDHTISDWVAVSKDDPNDDLNIAGHNIRYELILKDYVIENDQCCFNIVYVEHHLVRECII